MLGLYGKLPAHGDFVRRNLAQTFVARWDEWLQTCMSAAKLALDDEFHAVWAAAPSWRFCVPPGACGTTAVSGVLIPSHDMVGRLFPLTLALLLPAGVASPSADWYALLEQVGHDGRD